MTYFTPHMEYAQLAEVKYTASSFAQLELQAVASTGCS